MLVITLLMVAIDFLSMEKYYGSLVYYELFGIYTQKLLVHFKNNYKEIANNTLNCIKVLFSFKTNCINPCFIFTFDESF